MTITQTYDSPLGRILLTAEDDALTGLVFAENEAESPSHGDCEALRQTRGWLDVYFSGRCPDAAPPILLRGTPFRRAVWELLLKIPYGHVVTYGELAREISRSRGDSPRMSAQAVGGAVGHNPISLIVPCHRVVGSDGSLTGYAGGLDRKLSLLELEHSEWCRKPTTPSAP